MSVEVGDLYIEGISDCCSAKVLLPDICTDCGEHCEVVTEE